MGKPFSTGAVSLILKNRKYIGEYRYGDVVVPGGMPAIIGKDIFERVSQRMEANKKAPAKAKADEEYLLTTKLFCGTCGRMMAGESGKSGTKGIKYRYYKCSGAKRSLGCHRKPLRKDWIERVAVLLTVRQVLTDETIDRIADALEKIVENQTDKPAAILSDNDDEIIDDLTPLDENDKIENDEGARERAINIVCFYLDNLELYSVTSDYYDQLVAEGAAG